MVIKGSGLWNSPKPPRERQQAEKELLLFQKIISLTEMFFLFHITSAGFFFLFFFADEVGTLSILLCGFCCGCTNVSEPAPAPVPGKTLHQEGLQGRERAEEAAANTLNTAEIPIEHPPE